MSALELATPASSAVWQGSRQQRVNSISGAICQILTSRKGTNELQPNQFYLIPQNTKELRVIDPEVNIHAFDAYVR